MRNLLLVRGAPDPPLCLVSYNLSETSNSWSKCRLFLSLWAQVVRSYI